MQTDTKRLFYALIPPLGFVFILWIIWGIETGFGLNLYQLGIFPRSTRGLWGILTEPLVHSGLKHLFSNTVPLLILGWCLFYFYRDLGYVVFPLIWILSGIFTWCIGRDSWHIGASGLIYALAFFLFFSGVFRKYIPLLTVSLLVVFLYGSTVWNMFPIAELIDENVSWEGHLSGALSGLIVAIALRKEGPQKPQEPEEDDDEKDDTFPSEEAGLSINH